MTNKKDLDKYYGSRLEKYGPDDARSCGYVNEDSHRMRQKYLFELVNESGIKLKGGGNIIIDLGVGPRYKLYRDLFNYNLLDDNVYVGVEKSPKVLDFLSDELFLKVVDNNFSPIKGSCLSDSMDNLNVKANLIVCNGVYQDFDDIISINDSIKQSFSLLEKEGVFILIVPTNRYSGDQDEIYLSEFDLISIAKEINCPFKLEYGRLGKHASLTLFNKEIR